jgi:hypothetical protein
MLSENLWIAAANVLPFHARAIVVKSPGAKNRQLSTVFNEFFMLAIGTKFQAAVRHKSQHLENHGKCYADDCRDQERRLLFLHNLISKRVRAGEREADVVPIRLRYQSFEVANNTIKTMVAASPAKLLNPNKSWRGPVGPFLRCS